MKKLIPSLIIILFILLSSYGMRADLPYSRVATEREAIKFAVKFGNGDLNPHYFIHPPFFSYILFFLYGIFFLLGRMLGLFPTIFDYQKLYFTNPTIFYLIARSIIIILGTFSVLILYLLGKKLFNKTIALIACFFVAFSPIYIKWMHYATTDIPMFFFSMLSFYFIVRILQKGAIRDYILAGVLVGLAMATKYNAGLLMVPGIVAHFLNIKYNRNLKNCFDKKLILFFLFMSFSFFLANPFSILDYKSFLACFFEQSRRMTAQNYNFPSWKVNKPGWIYILSDTLPFALGRPLAILVVLAVLYSIYRHKKEDYLLLSLIFISYIVIGNWDIIKPRYFIYVFPLMLLLAARTIVESTLRIKFFNRYKNLIIVLFSILCMLPAFFVVIKFDILVSKIPVYIKAKKWIEANVPSGLSIATFVGIPLIPNEESIKRRIREIEEKKIGKGIMLRYLLKHIESFPVTYNIFELPFPWREDYDDRDFDFTSQINNGIEYFIFTPEVLEYLATPGRYRKQIGYINLVRKKCILIKEFRQLRPKVEPGYISDKEYVQIYHYER